MNQNPVDERPFEPKLIDETHEGCIAFFAFVPSEIEEGDFDKRWWPTLRGFPLNVNYSSTRQATNSRFALASALYKPDLETFRETETARELTYLNKLGGPYRVRVVLKKGGGMDAFKHRDDKLIASSHGKDFNGTMAQTTMIGIQDDEPVELTNY